MKSAKHIKREKHKKTSLGSGQELVYIRPWQRPSLTPGSRTVSPRLAPRPSPFRALDLPRETAPRETAPRWPSLRLRG